MQVLLVLVAALGCQGTVGSSAGRVGGGGPGGGRFTEETPAPLTRAARLSHDQWESSVRDLLRLDEGPGLGSTFRADPAQAGFLFGNDAQSLAVDQVLWGQYQRAAQDLAASVVGDPGRLGRILPAEGGDDEERARAFIEAFGARAHRRPLGDDDVDRYLALWQAGRTLYDGVAPFEAGIRLVLEAFLQSPYFLYRVEPSTEDDDGRIPLDGWEIASRLSYLVWNSMPDDELFAAAADGTLDDDSGVREQLDRMLDDPRADETVTRFHRLLFEVDDFARIAPSAAFFPGVSPELGRSAADEHDRFVDDVFRSGGGLGDLLTSTDTFVNAELARVYGLPDQYGPELERVSLDPAQRRGIFTHVGFLAANATDVNPDPIHRGVFLAKRIACIQIAAPPANVPPLPPIDPEMTDRQAVEAHTQQPGSVCANCHERVINRFGFPFEGYDASGAWRTEDAGQPVDTTSAPPIDGVETAVTGAVDLMDRLAASRDVHDCYLEHWIEFAYGRPYAEQDEPLVGRLGAKSLDDEASLRDLLVELATSPAFLTRSTEELP